jgi:hypothetical protein
MGYMDQFFPGLAGGALQGVVRITTDLSGISVVGLRGRVNNRLPDPDVLLATIPPTEENNLPGSEDRFFPQLVNGYGFKTQIILYSGTSGETSVGNVHFVRPDGNPLHLPVKP